MKATSWDTFNWSSEASHLFVQAVSFVDIPVMAAYLCLIALIFVTINLVVDLLYFVVDPRLRVHGVDGLRVCDASVFPTLIAGNTNAPSMMVGWKGAEIILADQR